MNTEKTLNSFKLTTGNFNCTLPKNMGYDRFFTTTLKTAEIPERYQGIAPYRYAGNPKEKLWAMFFLQKNLSAWGRQTGEFANHLIYSAANPEDEVTDQDMRLLATAFQWLGSPVGHQQMIELLCSLPENDKNLIIQRLRDTL